MRDRFDLRSMREAGLVQEFGNDFWSYQAILIPYLEGGKVTQLRAKHIGGNTIGLREVPTRLFNVDASEDARTVFICEGEMDAILLHQHGYPTVGVPGAGAFKDLWLRHFDSARRVFIIPDHDRVNEVTGERAGIEGAKRTQRLIGQKATIVELPHDGDVATDLTDYFIRDGHTKDEFARLIRDNTESRLSTFDSAYDEYVDLLSANGISTGFKDLDRFIFPGMLPGQVGIILAKTGVGKTTFATQLIWNFVDGDVPVLMMSLEQMKGEIASRLYKIARYSDTKQTPSSIAMSLNGLFRLNDENRMPPEDVPILIDEFTEQVGQRPKVVIVDYLGYWARSFKGGSAYEQTTAAIMELKNIAKREKLVIIAPHQVSRVGNRGEKLSLDMARDSGAIEETGDFVMSLYAPSHRDAADSTQMTYKDRADLRLDLLKSRHGNMGKTISMYFAPMSLAVRPATMMEQPRIQNEWAAFDRSLTYPEFDRERHA
jgi:archaellum biogenesis ATPase FlaH